MDFEQVLTLRQTTRKYTDQKVSDSDLEKILQAAQTAPLAAGDDKTTHLNLVFLFYCKSIFIFHPFF